MDMQRYLYRRQYVLGPRCSDGLIRGRSIDLSDGYYLTAHEDLAVVDASAGTNRLLLLGYILDPFRPALSDEEILRDIVCHVESLDDLLSGFCNKCGRYVVIAKIGNELMAFSDAAGMRQIFYSQDAFGSMWCGSQPHLIAQCLGVPVDETLKSDLARTTLFASEKYWYPGSVTLFDGIHHLLPNHYLDLKRKLTLRYWPTRTLRPVSVEECVIKSSELLAGIIESASLRFPNLAFAISSGLDSRILLAASRKNSQKIRYFTHLLNGGEKAEGSLTIPSAVCDSLGLRHLYVREEAEVDEDFEKIFISNVFTARRPTMLNAYAIQKQLGPDDGDLTVIYGNCAEITKRDRSRYPKLPKCLITGKSITEMALLSHSRTALKEFEGWLASLRSLAQRCNLDVLDLLHWEHRVGSWAAMSFHEYEMTFEVLCPYSCRGYIELLLAVPFKYRTKPEYLLQTLIARRLWPEVLRFPVNPSDSRARKAIEDFLYRTNLYDVMKYLSMMCYRRYRTV